MKPLNLIEIKNAILHDQQFRNLFPELQTDFAAVINNPSCGCNTPIFRKVFEYRDRLQQYFPNRIVDEKPTNPPHTNTWYVINCKADELESQLNDLHKFGRKQIAIARWEDEVTVVINEISLPGMPQ